MLPELAFIQSMKSHLDRQKSVYPMIAQTDVIQLTLVCYQLVSALTCEVDAFATL